MGPKKILLILGLLSLGISILTPVSGTQSNPALLRGQVRRKGVNLDIRSSARMKADRIAESGIRTHSIQTNVVPNQQAIPQGQGNSGNIQTNDGSLDNIQSFPPFLPFFHFNESETSFAVYGSNLVATYNTDAFSTFVQKGNKLVPDHEFTSGFSNSTDGGQTWTSSFIPPIPGSVITLGDPSIDVDRLGNFYFSQLGMNAQLKVTIQTNKSTDGGRSWSDAVVVQQDDGADKDWIAVGPDPVNKNRDNVYVTWTSFQRSGAQLRLGRSTDGGATWTTKTIFDPAPDFILFSNPYVDPITGRLYIPFLRSTSSDEDITSNEVDFIQMLVSDDAGESFSFANLNMQVVQPGVFCDCGDSGGNRLVISSGSDVGGRFGLSRFINATRIIMQPAIAASNGIVYLAYSASASPIVGNPSGNSNVMFIRSTDGGATWATPLQVNQDVATDIHHVEASLAIGADPNDVYIGYYTQHTDGKVDVDLANSNDMGNSFPANRRVRVTSTPFDLAPTNIQPSTDINITYNYDGSDPCYGLGEYISVKSAKGPISSSAQGTIYALWADGRKTVTHPPNLFDPLTGVTHPQQDVFFQAVKVQ